MLVVCLLLFVLVFVVHCSLIGVRCVLCVVRCCVFGSVRRCRLLLFAAVRCSLFIVCFVLALVTVGCGWSLVVGRCECRAAVMFVCRLLVSLFVFVVVRCLLCVAICLLFVGCSSFVVRCLLFAARCSSSVVVRWCVVRCALCVVCCSLFVVRCVFVVCCALRDVHCLFVVCCVLFVVCLLFVA